MAWRGIILMETLDKETIYGIVASGKYTRSETATLQGCKLTDEQRQWWNEATILKKAEADKRNERTAKLDGVMSGEGGLGRAMTGAERVRKHMMIKASIDDELDDALTRIDWERRRRCEASLLEFVKEYGTDEGAFLEDVPSASMEPILDEMQAAIDDSSVNYHIRVARGHGKTSYAKAGCAWAAATGKRGFIVVVGSNAANAQNIVNDIFTFFSESPKFRQDFPEVGVSFEAINGIHQRAAAQTYHGKPTRPKVGLGQIILPTIEGAKSSGCIIQAVGFATSARGKVKGKRRPDLLILDDLQTDDLAGNEDRVLQAAEHLKKTFMGLAGHKRKIAAVMTSTPIEPDDLSELFARDPMWKTTTHKMVMSWPTAWKTENPADDLWMQYRDILRREITQGNKTPHVVANEFYTAHREAMDEGAKVLNPGNFDEKTELSGIQHAMNILFRDGEDVFESEYQMNPRRHSFAFEVTAGTVLHRVRHGVAPLQIPFDCEFLAVATDINPSYALTTVATAFDRDRTALVTAYHISKINIDQNENETLFAQHVYDELTEHARSIRAALGKLRIDAWGIDAGGRQISPVCRFVQEGVGERLAGARTTVALIGRAYRVWNDSPRNKVRSAVNMTVQMRGERGRRWTYWNADFYKETVHRAIIAEVGSPGGLTIFDGGVDHTEFAIQVTNETLRTKRKLVNGYDYGWKSRDPHDYLDSLAMTYALAGANNINGDMSARVVDDDEVVFI